MTRTATASFLSAMLSLPGAAAAVELRAAVLRVDVAGRAPISRLDLPPDDLGFAGARVATADNATTGSFLGQTFVTEEVIATPETAIMTLDAILADGVQFVVTLADERTTLALADAAGDRALLFNARSPADALRNEACRPNLLHTAPSNAMLTDALAQFLMWKRWTDWLLVEGSHPEDQALAAAYRRAATKFGARIVEERIYEDRGGARATDSGHVQVQDRLPVLTQRAAEHDVVIAADAMGLFADYLPFHTWDARPVAGSAGLVPQSWTAAHEGWGGTQMQNRFEAAANRPARPEDYQVWMALRALGEAVTQTGSNDFATLSDYVRGPDFALAAFKGQELSFRSWDGQLRQPILLTTGRVTTSVSPQAEYLHQSSTLDTLGTDAPETGCVMP